MRQYFRIKALACLIFLVEVLLMTMFRDDDITAHVWEASEPAPTTVRTQLSKFQTAVFKRRANELLQSVCKNIKKHNECLSKISICSVENVFLIKGGLLVRLIFFALFERFGFCNNGPREQNDCSEDSTCSHNY